MKITTQGPTPTDLVKSREYAATAPAGKPTRPQAAESAAPASQLSETSKLVSSAFEQMDSQEAVDLSKVQAIRQALQDGTLQLDEDVLINTIMDMHR